MILKSQVDGKAKVMESKLIGLGLSKCENIILRAAFKKIFSFKTLGKEQRGSMFCDPIKLTQLMRVASLSSPPPLLPLTERRVRPR